MDNPLYSYLNERDYDWETNELTVKLPNDNGKIISTTMADGLIKIHHSNEPSQFETSIRLLPIFHAKDQYIDKEVFALNLVIRSIFFNGYISKFTDRDAKLISQSLNKSNQSIASVTFYNDVTASIRAQTFLANPKDFGGKHYIYTFLDNYFDELEYSQEYFNNYVSQSVSTRKDGGCYITTATCISLKKPDNCYELNLFRSFRDHWLVKQKDGAKLINQYYSISPKIVHNINQLPSANNIYQRIWIDFLKPCLLLLEEQKYYECKKRYTEMVKHLMHTYL